MAFNNLRKLAVFALSAAMIVSLGACGTSEKSDSAASSDSESSSNTTGYDVSGVTKDDDIAAMLPESVTKDASSPSAWTRRTLPPNSLRRMARPRSASMLISRRRSPICSVLRSCRNVEFRFDHSVDRHQVRYRHFVVHHHARAYGSRRFREHVQGRFHVGGEEGQSAQVATSDLCGLKIAVQTGTTQEEEVNAAAKQCKADGKSEVQILSNKLQTDVTTNVATGKADVFYADSPVAGYAIAQTEDTLEALGEDVGVTKEPWQSKRAIPIPPRRCRPHCRSSWMMARI